MRHLSVIRSIAWPYAGLLLTVTAAAGECIGTADRFIGYYPFGFQYTCPLNTEVTELVEAAINRGMSYEYRQDAALSNAPEANLQFLTDASDAKVLVLISHGDGGVYTEAYASATARDDAYVQYKDSQTGLFDAEHLRRADHMINNVPVYMIGLEASGIEYMFDTYGYNDGAIYCVASCSSMTQSARWLNDVHQTILGKTGDLGKKEACRGVHFLLDGIGCLSEPFAGPRIDYFDDPGDSLVACLEVEGNHDNAADCSSGCANLVTRVEVTASVDSIRVLLWEARRGEKLECRFGNHIAGDRHPLPVVSPVRLSTSPWATAAFGAAVAEGAEEAEMRVISTSGRTRLSRRLVLAELPRGAFAVGEREVGDVLEADIGSGSGADWLECNGSVGDKSLPPDCADVVVYGMHSPQVALGAQHWAQYPSGLGGSMVVRAITGDGSANQIRTIVEQTIDANLSYNEACAPACQRTFPERPLLVLMEMGIGRILRPDDEGVCTSGYCRSWYDYGDVDGDGRPDVPVQVVPDSSGASTPLVLDAADDWNSGTFVESPPRWLCLVGDEESGISEPERRSGLRVGATLGSNGYSPIVMTESGVPGSSATRTEIAVSRVNEGVSAIWVQGLETSANSWTDFYRGADDPTASLSKKQRILVFGPTCQLTDKNIWHYRRNYRKLMWNGPERTVAVMVVGQMNGDYEMRHMDFGDALASALVAAASGTPISRIVFDVVHGLNGAMLEYGRGVCVFGGHVLWRDDGDVSDVRPDVGPSEGTPRGRIEVTVLRTETGLALKYHLPRGGQPVFELFDVDGRRVWHHREEAQAEGWHTLDLADVQRGRSRSGVLLARVSCGATSTTAKLVVVK